MAHGCDDRLFVYGCLLATTDHPMARWLASRSERLGVARCAGRLYDLGAYPGLVLDGPERGVPADGDDAWSRHDDARRGLPARDDQVTGMLLSLPDPEAVWPALDAHEGHPDLFRRTRVTVHGDHGPEPAWTYVYQGTYTPAMIIRSGRWGIPLPGPSFASTDPARSDPAGAAMASRAARRPPHPAQR